jgi:hypothetical protein
MNRKLSTKITIAAFLVSCFASFWVMPGARAASWNGIEPFRSRRDEVMTKLGKPLREESSGALHFKVAGGEVIVSFVDEKFVNTKKLRADLVGTVLEIVLQHEGSSNTVDAMKLAENKSFIRDAKDNAVVFRNPKEGIAYTFVNGKLRTTRYTFSDGQLGRAHK